VATGGVRQPGYRGEHVQERPGEYAPAVFAAGRVASEGLEFVRLAERTREWVGPVGEGVVFHLLVVSDLSDSSSSTFVEQMHHSSLKNTDLHGAL